MKPFKQTENRHVIIQCLTDLNPDCGGVPPYAASDIQYMLDEDYGFYGAAKPVSISQINRTLRDLHEAGVIVFELRLDEDCGNRLPQRVKHWQMAADVERNRLIDDCNKLYSKVDKAKHGLKLFVSVFDMGLPEDEVKALAIEVKRLLQRTHPDKATGFDYQFEQLKQCRDWLKSGIPLPTPTHTAAQQQQTKTGRLRNLNLNTID